MLTNSTEEPQPLSSQNQDLLPLPDPQVTPKGPQKLDSKIKSTLKPDPILMTELKTPLKQSNFDQNRTFGKESLEKTEVNERARLLDSEQTEVKAKSDFRVIQGDQNETEARKYYKLIGSTVEKQDNHERIEESEVIRRDKEHKPTQILSTSRVASEKASTCSANTPRSDISQCLTGRKKRYRTFEKTPLYATSKRIKKNPAFFQETLEVLDKMKNQNVKFRLFKDQDLGYSKFIQNTVRASKVDDDCPTDSDQMELARKHVQKQLRQALDLENWRDTASPTFSSNSKFSSNESTSRGISSFGPNSSFKKGTFSRSELTEESVSPSDEIKKVVKRLSYSKAKESVEN